MPLPGGATGFQLTGGPYDDPAFQGMAGVLTMSTPVTHVATGERIRKTWNFSIDYSGNFSVGPLPFSDDPAFSPTGFTYTITWQALSYKDTPGNLTFAVPRGSDTAGVVDFDKLAPTTTGIAVPSAVLSVNGRTGAVTIAEVPAGGTSGQVLAKTSSTDYAVGWVAQTGGGGGAVASVNGHTGTVVLAASDVGADAAGAATTAQTAAIAAAATDATTKANAAQAAAVQRANHTGTQAATTITGLATVATSGAYADLSGKPTVPTVGAAGAGAAVALSSTDATVTNARTPIAHAATHAAGGSDAITPASIGGTLVLTPTATKTAAYTAAVGDLAMMNVAGGATVLMLPTAPADKSQVGYRAIGATAAVPLAVNRGGSDTIGTAGATSASLPMPDEVVVLQYDATNTRWLAVSAVKTQASLDARYLPQVDSLPNPQPVTVAGWTTVYSDTTNAFSFPPRVLPPQTNRKRFVVRNRGNNPLWIGYSTGDEANYNKPADANFTANGVINPGQEWVEGPSEQAVFARPTVTGNSVLVSVYVELGA